MNAANDAAASVRDAEWLAHRYDATTDAVQFRHVARAQHGEAAFLTDDCLGTDGERRAAPMTAVLSTLQPARQHFIFHSAFCASTLLVRAFDSPGLAMGLSEPVILNDIVGIRRRGGAPRGIARALDGALRLLARPFAPGETVVVKPSNVANPLIPAMLRLSPTARAVLLHAPLDDFLASVARKGMWCRLWGRELLAGLLQDGAVDLGFTPDDYFRQTDLQVAAVGWLAQHAQFARLLASDDGPRLVSLDSATLLASPAPTMKALATHFGLSVDADAILAIANGPAFTRHSKSGGAFTASDRERERAAASTAHGDEIAKVGEWAGAVASNAGIALALARPLVIAPD